MGYIVITGANGGIGRAVAELLQSKDYQLLLLDIDSMKDNEIIEKKDVISLEIDVSDQESVQTFVDFVNHRGLEISGLIHLAGITRDKTLLNMSLEKWQQVIDVNLTGTFLMLKAVANLMKENGGSIVLTGSTSARYGNFGQLNYVASKAGVEGMTKTAARELAKYNIRVNCIVPGFIQTQMTDKIPEEHKKNLVSQVPLQRMGQPIDVAQLISFLISDQSSYITGSSLKIDGGLKM